VAGTGLVVEPLATSASTSSATWARSSP